MRFTRITIIRTQKPESYDVNALLQWFGGTVGLFSIRDKDRSCFRVFIELIKNGKKEGEGLTSDDLAELTGLTRGTVVHHLNRLMEAGMVLSQKNKYYLKTGSLEALVDVVRADVDKTFEALKEVGKKLDKVLDMK